LTFSKQLEIYVLIAQVIFPITNKIKHLIIHKDASGLVVVVVVLFSWGWYEVVG
jgi:hypothetical protein